MSKWQNGVLNESESIRGKNLFIKTGGGSGIMVFDVDVKPDPEDPSTIINAFDNLMDVGIDFDDYIDHCIKISTQSGAGRHYIFKYDERFPQGANCYGVEGFDILNDGGIIFAGERYDIVSTGKNFEDNSCLTQVFETLSEAVEEVEEKVKHLRRPKKN
jgi:hypothetical protein